jgi:hypothetical protein
MQTRKPALDIKQNSKGMTRLLVAIPLGQRLGLADLSARTEIAQQELISQAIQTLLDTHGVETCRDLARPINVRLARKSEEPTRPAQPSPNHIWVQPKGRQGYWKAPRATSK